MLCWMSKATIPSRTTQPSNPCRIVGSSRIMGNNREVKRSHLHLQKAQASPATLEDNGAANRKLSWALPVVYPITHFLFTPSYACVCASAFASILWGSVREFRREAGSCYKNIKHRQQQANSQHPIERRALPHKREENQRKSELCHTHATTSTWFCVCVFSLQLSAHKHPERKSLPNVFKAEPGVH